MNLRIELQKNDKEHKYENEKLLEKEEKILELLTAQNEENLKEIQSLQKNNEENKYENEKLLEKDEKILELLAAQNEARAADLKEIQSLHIQLAVVMLACALVSVTTFMKL